MPFLLGTPLNIICMFSSPNFCAGVYHYLHIRIDFRGKSQLLGTRIQEIFDYLSLAEKVSFDDIEEEFLGCVTSMLLARNRGR